MVGAIPDPLVQEAAQLFQRMFARLPALGSGDQLIQVVHIGPDRHSTDVADLFPMWIHAEGLVHKLDTFTAQHRAAQARVRGRIWGFYASLKAYLYARSWAETSANSRKSRAHL